jgi:hypothetical protein
VIDGYGPECLLFEAEREHHFAGDSVTARLRRTELPEPDSLNGAVDERRSGRASLDRRGAHHLSGGVYLNPYFNLKEACVRRESRPMRLLLMDGDRRNADRFAYRLLRS